MLIRIGLLVVFHGKALLREQVEALSLRQLALERRHCVLRRSELSRQERSKVELLLLELLLQLIMLQLKLLLQLIALLLLKELLDLHVDGTRHLMLGEPISREEELLLTIAARLQRLSTV